MALSSGAGQDNNEWGDVLLELSEKSQMEDLRVHLKACRIIPRTTNPDTCAIKLEHLQKLARAWKMHHQRGFWREHPTQADLIRVLHRHMLTLKAPIKPKDIKGRRSSLSMTYPGPGGAGKPSESKPMSPGFQTLFKPYAGDKFTTRGNYTNGNIYMSRMQLPPASGQGKTAEQEGLGPGASFGGHSSHAMHAIHASHGNTAVPRRTSGMHGAESHSVMAATAPAAMPADPITVNTTMELQPDEVTEEAINHIGRSLLDDDEIKRNCALALCNFSSQEGFRSRIVEAGAISALVALWETTDGEMKQDCAIALCHLTGDDTEVRMVNEGALPPILSLCSTDSADEQALAANTLVKLSSVKDNQGTMAQEGVVPALTMLAGAGPVEVKRLCALVLTHLSSFKVRGWWCET